jgi:hypothetical protein
MNRTLRFNRGVGMTSDTSVVALTKALSHVHLLQNDLVSHHKALGGVVPIAPRYPPTKIHGAEINSTRTYLACQAPK